MQNTRVILISQMCRHLFTSSVKKTNASKQSRIMENLIRKDQSKSTYNPVLSINGTPHKQLSIHTKRRMAALSKIFMQHITDMMSTGEVEPCLLERNIEIYEVKVTADFKLINVYWIDNSTHMSDTEEILRRCAYQLRYQLTQLRVIGCVPPIQFVKYKHFDKVKEVERRLAVADYGEDYVPSTYPLNENCIVTSSSSADKSDSASENGDTFKISLPAMRHDVFGLDHARIMSKIKVSLSQSRQTLKKRTENSKLHSISVTESKVQNVPNFVTAQEQEEQFSKFLAQKRKEQKLKRKNSQAKNTTFNINEENEYKQDEYEYEYKEDEYDEGRY